MKFYSLFLTSSPLTFPSTSNFSLYCIRFTSSSTKPITKLKKGVGQSKSHVAKLAIVKNTSSKLKRRSHKIASKLAFSNTQDNPIKIEEAKEEVSMHREEIVFTDESKKKDSSVASEGDHSFNDLSESEDGHFSIGQGSIGQTPPTLLLTIPQVNTLPLFSLLFSNFYFPYLFLLQVSPWSTLHLEARAVPSLNLSFMDQVTPHVEPPSRPPTELDVVVACSIISHLLSLDLLSLSTSQKYVFHVAMAVLQFASLDPEAEIFLSGVTHRAPEVFSSIEHVVKENAQVISELEKLREKKSEYEKFKLSTDQSIQRLEELKIEFHAQEERIRLLATEMERETAKLSSLIRQGEVLHA